MSKYCSAELTYKDLEHEALQDIRAIIGDYEEALTLEEVVFKIKDLANKATKNNKNTK